ncbi:DNA polymerase-3 subunit epsilon [Sphingomonas guangdongensis]|uniref:DNA polymerase-3 subunit epsilon n=1 Tax=Sphingomonas guangdongensis TaxID=1141890 RepID=A0A285QZ03_9SPHN|nr:3'-5' exonuclease [Sphingomonas guangdongensis]SOB87143.1 DNA polymerase-3 subunit epsilon [Sphingomonas guangdongensis]
MNEPSLDLENLAKLLCASGDYRVQRRLSPRSTVSPPDGTPTKSALLIDVETTGLDVQKDEIIELAMISFTYSLDGRVFEIGETFQRFQEPSAPISPEITRITGITDAMVAGHKIDVAEVAAFAGPAALVIAHNAAFDRRFAERLSEVFTTKPWACSMSQIDWAVEGFEGTKLHYLAAGAGFFYDRHRAEHDCRAVIELLASPLPVTNRTALANLLEAARLPTWRIWAENSPFDLKDALKARGYRWNGDGNPNPRAWYIDVDDARREAEISFLRKEIYLRDVELLVHRMDAYNRFSDRKN